MRVEYFLYLNLMSIKNEVNLYYGRKLYMYNFEQYLEDGESILYIGTPVPGKGSKNLCGLLFALSFVLGIMALLIWSVVAGIGDGASGINFNFIIIVSVLLIFIGFIGWAIIYNLFIKKNVVKDDIYCLTNKRAFKYEFHKNKLVYGYLCNYKEVRVDGLVDGLKDNYGDVYMGIVYGSTGDSRQDLSNVTKLMFNPNPKDMPYLIFESI